MKLQWLFVTGAFALTTQVAQGRFEYQPDVDSVRHDVQVRLEPAHGFVPASESVRMTVTFANFGSDPVTLTSWFVPGEELDLQLFSVSRDGHPVEYLGPLVKRGSPSSIDLLVLQPGETISVPVDLSSAYDFSADGEYTVSYQTRSSHLFGPDQVVLLDGAVDRGDVRAVQDVELVDESHDSSVARDWNDPKMAPL